MRARNLFTAIVAALVVAAIMTAGSSALTRRHDVSGDDMHDFGVSFRSVGWIEAELTQPDPGTGQRVTRYCSAVLVTPETAITAAHCVTGNNHEIDVNVNLTTFYLGNFRISPQVQAPVASIELSPGWACDDCESNGLYRAGWDVAVLHFGITLFEPTVSRIYIGEMVGRDVAIVGYGKLSTGLESFESFAASAQDGRKMAGTNVVDRVDDFGPVSSQSHAWLFDFDSPECDKPWVSTIFGPATSDICPTDMEASYGAGDSGGPMFVSINGEWMLAGVASSIFALHGEYGTYGQMAFVSNLTLEQNLAVLAGSNLLDNAVIATPTPTPTATATAEPTATLTPTPPPTPTAIPTGTPMPTVSPTPTRTATPAPPPTGVAQPSPTPVAPGSPIPTVGSTATAGTATPAAASPTIEPDPAAAGSCNNGGPADGALLLLPLGLLLLALRRPTRVRV